ncbi:hypothetical protein KC19_VG128200 [Ceratodon purpureus]|uniref:Uncharacterized protein n=1 Tax=Ceratodon purpureus TaxID=3225 RepID=A0A8T0HQJ3_CERPU|nr:hypothetical protein KC19_VG128200 [Ceratodon purpureus]
MPSLVMLPEVALSLLTCSARARPPAPDGAHSPECTRPILCAPDLGSRPHDRTR